MWEMHGLVLGVRARQLSQPRRAFPHHDAQWLAFVPRTKGLIICDALGCRFDRGMPRPTRRHTPTHPDGRPLKITFGEMREMGLRGVLIYCRCGHHVAFGTDRWPDDVRLSDVEPRFVCTACGGRGADVRPDFNWNAKGPIGGMGYR